MPEEVVEFHGGPLDGLVTKVNAAKQCLVVEPHIEYPGYEGLLMQKCFYENLHNGRVYFDGWPNHIPTHEEDCI
jgi:hypothetical protein